VGDTGPLGILRGLGVPWAVAAMNAMRLSRTAFWMGSVVAPSKVKPLITVFDDNTAGDARRTSALLDEVRPGHARLVGLVSIGVERRF
jgi:hypothetical protein